jgi:carbonic anhydrase
MSGTSSDQSRERLISGVRRFQREVYPLREAKYRQLSREGQKPHALFIARADSRIDPETLTQSGPGEIFVSRNIGNLVPAYGEMLGAVSAIIEFAVAALQVNHVEPERRPCRAHRPGTIDRRKRHSPAAPSADAPGCSRKSRARHTGASGWVYDIANGTVRVYDERQRRFIPMTRDEQTTAGGVGQ